MADLYRKGKTLQEIGDLYGVSRERVRQLIKKLGVSRHDGGIHLRGKLHAQRRADIKRARRDARFTKTYGCDHATAVSLNDGLNVCSKGSAADQYRFQRHNAQIRGVPWGLTFPQWMQIWTESGHLHERGRSRDAYCMARKHDKGGYVIGNVYITTLANNVSDYQAELKIRGVECADGWRRLPERAHHVSGISGWDVHRKNGLGTGRGWAFIKHQTKRPYQVVVRNKYIGSFATAQQAELAYRMACNEILRKQVA